jgi:hypothetical protein
MRFQLLGEWPVGQYAIPASTVIEVIDGRANWQGHKLPMPVPINALALDAKAYEALCAAYPERLNELHFDRTVVKPKR